MMQLFHGDCREVLRGLEADSVHACVTDPPYGLSFMGKGWDKDVPGPEYWREVWRVLKPGAHLVAFAGTRTYHRMATAIEDAGFEIRDMGSWLFGSGFPKSMCVARAIDKHFGFDDADQFPTPWTDEAKAWLGHGTAAKPASEPFVIARKPLSEPTIAANVLRHGTGAINVDAGRVGAGGDKLGGGMVSKGRPKASEGWDRPWMHDPDVTERKKVESAAKVATAETLGRWPAHLAHDGSDAVRALFPETGKTGSHVRHCTGTPSVAKGKETYRESRGHNDNGGSAARFFHCAEWTPEDAPFFYCAKATRAERAGSRHPTVKPLKLMRWLVRLFCPPGGIVLDPFAGTGTTLAAALAEGFQPIGIEREAEYVDDIRRRLDGVQLGLRAAE